MVATEETRKTTHEASSSSVTVTIWEEITLLDVPSISWPIPEED
jgi:hypothetical protein